MKKNRIKRIIISLIILSAAFIILFISNAFSWAQNKAYDTCIKISSKNRIPSEEIGLVLLDQESLDWAKENLQWSWPWPRKSYACITDYFARANAASLAFDMIYSEPSVYGPADDMEFARSCKNYGKVIQTVFYSNNNLDEATKPIPILEESSAKLGNISSMLDKGDRTARRSAIYPLNSRTEYGLSITSYILKNGSINLEKIPQAKNGGMYIRYVDDLIKFIPYSAYQIIQSELKIKELEKKFSGKELNQKIEELSETDETFIPPYQFNGMYMFFGLYAPGLFDICSTPVSASYPGVGVHLCQLDTILKEDYIRDIPTIFSIFLILIFVAAGFLLGNSIKQAKIKTLIQKTFIMVISSVIYSFATYFLFLKGILIPYVVPIAAFIISYIAAIFEAYMTEGSQRRYLKSAFKQYLSPAVIDKILEDPQMLNLGGEEREITAYFSDVQGFTSISEKLSPTELTELLNTYLSAMTDIILSYGGTIDKYEGDAIIAFWGAPSIQKDHAARAINAALECQKKLQSMQEVLTAKTGVPFVQRIGINTGKAVVGNMGSKSRFDYTMMGDTVNLASRLEGINKQFDTYTMCSESTMQSAVKNGCNADFRKLAKIAVVGKKESIQVYIPMSHADFNSLQKVDETFREAYSLFETGNFLEAQKTFDKISDIDFPAKKLSEKCRHYIKNPPESWDGTIYATEK